MGPLIDPLRHPTATRIVLDESQSAELGKVLDASPSLSCFVVVARDTYPGDIARFVLFVVPCTLAQAQAVERQILHPEETGKTPSKPAL
jgi:hypothetical protein